MLLSVILATALLASSPVAEPDQYVVDFRDTASKKVRVSAEVTLVNGRLHIETYTTAKPGYWRSLISGLTALDESGNALQIDSVSASEWRAGSAYSGRARLNYFVDYSFASRPFPSGNQKGGLNESGGIYLVTKPLFITPDSGDAESVRSVRIQVPAGWQIATPWQAGSQDDYRVPGRRDLAINSIAVGKIVVARAQLGRFDVSAVFIGPIAQDSATVAAAFKKAANEYFRIFPNTSAGRYMMTLFYADHDDGEGFASSSAITFGNRIAGGDGILFNNKIAHELLHYWMGQRIRGRDRERMSWLTEGFTEYIANRTIQRVGLITRQEYLDKLSRHVGAYSYYWYSPLFNDRTVYEGGADKTANRLGVYDGGAVAALCLDLMIREQTGGRRSIDDLLQRLWNDYGVRRQPFTLEEFSAALVEVGGTKFQDFVSKYVTGHELLPYETVLPAAGIRVRAWPLAAEAYLSVDPVASTAAATKRERDFFGGSR